MSDQAAQEMRDGFPFLAGRLWLDFLNSAPATMGELIARPDDLARWARAAGIDRAGRPAFTKDDVAADVRALVTRTLASGGNLTTDERELLADLTAELRRRCRTSNGAASMQARNLRQIAQFIITASS